MCQNVSHSTTEEIVQERTVIKQQKKKKKYLKTWEDRVNERMMSSDTSVT